MAEREFILNDISEHDYEVAGSKFITMYDAKGNPVTSLTKEHLGLTAYRDVECQTLDWDKVGTSMKIPFVILSEGQDKNKEDKISFGVKKDGIWKGKEIYKNISGKDMPMKQVGDTKHPAPKPSDIQGKKAVAMYQVQEGFKGGDPNAEKIFYPKVVSLLPADFKPAASTDQQPKDIGI